MCAVAEWHVQATESAFMGLVREVGELKKKRAWSKQFSELLQLDQHRHTAHDNESNESAQFIYERHAANANPFTGNINGRGIESKK